MYLLFLGIGHGCVWYTKNIPKAHVPTTQVFIQSRMLFLWLRVPRLSSASFSSRPIYFSLLILICFKNEKLLTVEKMKTGTMPRIDDIEKNFVHTNDNSNNSNTNENDDYNDDT